MAVLEKSLIDITMNWQLEKRLKNWKKTIALRAKFEQSLQKEPKFSWPVKDY